MKYPKPKPDGRLHPKAIYRPKSSKEEVKEYIKESEQESKYEQEYKKWCPKQCVNEKCGNEKSGFKEGIWHDKKRGINANPIVYMIQLPKQHVSARCKFCNKKFKTIIDNDNCCNEIHRYIPRHKNRNYK